MINAVVGHLIGNIWWSSFLLKTTGRSKNEKKLSPSNRFIHEAASRRMNITELAHVLKNFWPTFGLKFKILPFLDPIARSKTNFTPVMLARCGARPIVLLRTIGKVHRHPLLGTDILRYVLFNRTVLLRTPMASCSQLNICYYTYCLSQANNMVPFCEQYTKQGRLL